MENIQYIVFDEADKYFELGMANQIRQILQIFSDQTKICYALFSATIQHSIEEIMKNYLTNPVLLTVGGKNNVLNTIEQKLIYCQNEYGKLCELKHLINNGGFTPPVLLFVQSKERGQELLEEIQKSCLNTDIKIETINSDKSKQDREKIITDFRTGKLWALICTDLMARGIDFRGVELVINYDFPMKVVDYIHRVGRCGRAQMKGLAHTYYTNEDKPLLKRLGNMLKLSGLDVPDWILQLKSTNKKQRKFQEKFPVKREHISLDPEKQKVNDPQFDKIISWADRKYENKNQNQEEENDGEWNIVPEDNEGEGNIKPQENDGE